MYFKICIKVIWRGSKFLNIFFYYCYFLVLYGDQNSDFCHWDPNGVQNFLFFWCSLWELEFLNVFLDFTIGIRNSKCFWTSLWWFLNVFWSSLWGTEFLNVLLDFLWGSEFLNVSWTSARGSEFLSVFSDFFMGIRISERFLEVLHVDENFWMFLGVFCGDQNFFIPAWVFWGDHKLRILQ